MKSTVQISKMMEQQLKQIDLSSDSLTEIGLEAVRSTGHEEVADVLKVARTYAANQDQMQGALNLLEILMKSNITPEQC